MPSRTTETLPAWRAAVLSALWGFAEATLFFIVPDVAISFAALHSRRTALVAAASATAGALVGGAVMWWWGGHVPTQAFGAIANVPAISSAMIEGVVHQTDRLGLLAVLTGPLLGTPYKIYAAQWGRIGGAIAPFMLVSIVARAPRFLLVGLGTSWIATAAKHKIDPRSNRARALVLAFWVIFYAYYLTTRSW